MENAAFDTYLPVKVLFGVGKINEAGRVASQYGHKAMLVTVPWDFSQIRMFQKIKGLLEKEGVDVVVFDKVVSNPTTTIIDEGADIARKSNVDVVIAVGGGSSIDAAKAIAVGATHPGVAWDYVYIKRERPTARTLPVIAITTTSGTGSHVTKYAVFTNPEFKTKSTIVDPAVFPKVAIVDPELMLSLPEYVTATTGFDAFSHAFESYTNINCNPFIDMLAIRAISIIIECLPKVLKDPDNLPLRRELAYADTLSGVCIANVGTTLPHSIGQPISGKYPHVAHGESLAVIYPEFFKFTYATCIPKFATVARIFNPQLNSVSDEAAAKASTDELSRFLKTIGILTSLEKLGVSDAMLDGIVKDAMDCPDTYVTTAVPDTAKVREMLNRVKKI